MVEAFQRGLALRQRKPVFVVVLVGIGVWSVGHLATAQAVATAPDAIRVQSSQVLVPVVVFDQERSDELGRSRVPASREAEMPVLEAWAKSMASPGLTAMDFRLFQDGAEQKISSVSFEVTPYWNFRDNAGYHTEVVGPGGGKWSGPEWPTDQFAEFYFPHYVIAYQPPDSSEGSCHAIKVKVDRPNTLVHARREYCNTSHSAADVLKGTKFGKKIEGDLTSADSGQLGISLTTVLLFADSNNGRVDIVVDLPLKGPKSREIGIMGIANSKDGATLARFSDHADLVFGEAPVRYETQIILPIGEYDLRVAFRNGGKFGRVETSVVVSRYDRTGLAVSEIALCKQIQQSGASRQTGTKLAGTGTWTDMMPGNYVPLIANGIEFKPTANVSFTPKQIMYVYFQVYDPLSGSIRPTVKVQLRIIDVSTGRIVKTFPPEEAAPYFKEDVPVIPTEREIPLNSLADGSYQLQVQAVEATGEITPWRTANFTIEP